MTTTTKHITQVATNKSGRHVAMCDVCGYIGRSDGEDIWEDAVAIADRHAEIGGFERR